MRADIDSLLEQKAVTNAEATAIATAVAQEMMASFEKKMAEKEAADKLAELEKIIAELKQQIKTQTVSPSTTIAPYYSPSFVARVYNGSNFDSYVGMLADPWPINFDWGEGGPLNLANNFSIRWEGDVYFEAGNYDFSIRVNEGTRLFIDNLLLIDKWGPASTREYSKICALSTGYHRIKLEYRDVAGQAEVFLSWLKQ
jgi:hypothetical protein